MSAVSLAIISAANPNAQDTNIFAHTDDVIALVASFTFLASAALLIGSTIYRIYIMFQR